MHKACAFGAVQANIEDAPLFADAVPDGLRAGGNGLYGSLAVGQKRIFAGHLRGPARDHVRRNWDVDIACATRDQGAFQDGLRCGARRIAGRGRGAVETVDEAKLQGLFSWDVPATCDHLEPCFEPGKTGRPLRAPGARNDPKSHLRQTHAQARQADAGMGRHSHLQPAAQRGAVQHADQRGLAIF